MNVTGTMDPQAAAQQPAIDPDGAQKPDIRALIESHNIAEKMDKDDLEELGAACSEGFEADLESRRHWEDNLIEWQRLALQVKEDKTWPWSGASNVKYPLLSIASMQFNARAYPSLVPATSDIVKCEIIGQDPEGSKLDKAKRISQYMSYQILNQMDGWEEDMDKLLLMLPIIGTMFKKTYYNPVIKQNVSELILPKNLVVNYWAKSLGTAERVSEMIELNKRLLKEKQMAGTYLDIDLGDPQVNDVEPQERDRNVPLPVDSTTPYSIIEQHTYWDMDGDGYAEPYIVTFERFTGKVLRVVARFDDECVHMIVDSKGKQKLAKIDAIQYYTKFGFIPNPEGGFYDIGFGLLLAPLNESVNTLINQLIDSGTIANLQGGFLGKGLKLKMGESRWQPGEWKSVQSTSEDLRKQIVPLPAKDPSDVLFKLMGTLITGAKELASVAEIFVGKMPGQNTPATTTMATIEQGMKVFTAVYKRVYRSLRSEFQKIFALNSVYLDPQEYSNIIDGPIDPSDFDDKTYDVCPGADPNTATATEKLMKAQGLMEIMQGAPGILDPVKVVARILEAQEQPSYQQLFSQATQGGTVTPPPPPDPKIMAIQAKSQAEQQKNENAQQNDAFQAQLDQASTAAKLQMEKQAQDHDLQIKAMQAKLDGNIKLHAEQVKIAAAQASHIQTLTHAAQTHNQKLTHQEELTKSKIQMQNKSTNSGKKPR